jgi:hypothetical protein
MSSLEQQQQLNLLLLKLEEIKYILQKNGESFGPTALFLAFQAFTSPTSESSTDFSEIIAISEKLKKINEAICFCKEILRKQGSCEELTENENMFLEYVFMVSQLSSGLIKDIRSLESLFCHEFNQYNSSIEYVLKDISKKFNAFQMFMTYSYYYQRRNENRILAGSPSKRERVMTQEDHHAYALKSQAKNAKYNKFASERDSYLLNKRLFLERISHLLKLIADTMQMFELDDFSALEFFKSGFNAQKFTSVRDEHLKIQEMFQSLNHEIESFSMEIKSLTIRNQIKPESDEFLAEWDRCYSQGLPFHGKQD